MNVARSTPISVCMATYNGEKYVAEQMASILPQLAPGDELVVSDDCSTDRTLDIVRGFGHPQIKVMGGTRFASPIRNFEHALRHATNDILVLSDQDDVWLPNKLEVVRKSFAEPHPPVFAVVLNGTVVDSELRELHPSLFGRLRSGNGLLKNIYDNTFLGCCMAFSRPALELALPFPPRIPMHDMWIGLVASALGEVRFVDEKTIQYRKHSGSMTDFRREFKPWLQIRRRAYLTYSLARRVWERRSGDALPIRA